MKKDLYPYILVKVSLTTGVANLAGENSRIDDYNCVATPLLN